uniref:Uncharacterized protein n=1 Tax=Avena sativa TaxID=4498 RepID=A0ACD5TWH3_AVESA
MATNGSSGKNQEIRSKGKWKATTDPKFNFRTNQHENRSQNGARKHITCYCCGYPGHFTQECPRWNGPPAAPLGSSPGMVHSLPSMHITCYCCGYPGHYTQECPRWNGSQTAPLGSSYGRQETIHVSEDQCLTLDPYQQNIESRFRQDQMDGVITCMVCGEEGHYTCDCPMKDQEDKVICTLCSKKGHCGLWCCQKNKSENLACTRCGEIGHSASTNGLSCSSCDEYHPHGECQMNKVTCFVCDSQDHYLAQCPVNSVLTAVYKDQRENFQAALRLALSKEGNTLSTPAKPSTESQVCKPSFAKQLAGKQPKPPRKCYSCGEEGHFSNCCPSKPKVRTPKSNPNVRTGNATTPVLKTIYLECNEGHYDNHCPQKFGATSTNLSRELKESSIIPTSSNLSKELEEQDPSTAKHSSEMKPISSVGCFSCGEEGHRARSCPLKHQLLNIDKSSPLVTVDNIPTRVLVCFSCREEGHYSFQCSQKRQKR